MTPLASALDGNDTVQAGRSSYGNACFAGLVSYTPVPLVSATNVYVDWERGNRQLLTLTSDVNVYFVNPKDATYHLLIEQQGDNIEKVDGVSVTLVFDGELTALDVVYTSNGRPVAGEGA